MILDMNNNPSDKPVDGDLKRARRTSEESPLPPDPQVEVNPARCRFTTQYNLSILEQADQCQHSGEIGALLRREGLYSSHLSNCRRHRQKGALQKLGAQTHGPKPNAAAAGQREIARLQKRVSNLERDLDKAHTIIDVQ